MRRGRGLLDNATLEGIEIPFLTEEEQLLAAREYGICVILDRITGDEELRGRVRELLKTLKGDKPGPKPIIPDLLLYKIVTEMKKNGTSMARSFKLLARPGLAADSLKTKYKRGKKIAEKKKGTEK
ncbi:hypothetical protein MCEMSEM52_00709 [Burkholderiales bacterium]